MRIRIKFPARKGKKSKLAKSLFKDLNWGKIIKIVFLGIMWTFLAYQIFIVIPTVFKALPSFNQSGYVNIKFNSTILQNEMKHLPTILGPFTLLWVVIMGWIIWRWMNNLRE